MKITAHLFLASLSVALCGCALIELSGTMTRKTGEVMEDYSQKNEGFVAKAAGFGGKINTAVGTTVEGIAQKGKTDDGSTSKTGQFVDANKKVLTAAFDSVSPRAGEPASSENAVLKTQKRLLELGYDVGTPDGVMGKRTKSALGQYQAKNGLRVTNAPDTATLAALGVTEK